MEAYVGALLRDLQQKSPLCADHRVDTIYFGGGTPTLLPKELLVSILERIFCLYDVSPHAEITAECNPATENAALFRAMRGAGFNRLSIGLQSAHQEELKALGRIHSPKAFEQTVEDARAAGFSNISADVMFGIPEQTVERFLETLAFLKRIAPEHISVYGLTLEEGTPFFCMGDALRLPEEEQTEKMYFEAIRSLCEGGFKQYEISNFAKEGYESRHNLKYWNCEEYLGFGVAAHSDFCGVRFGNSRDFSAYIEGGNILEEQRRIGLEERKNEYVMLGMRLSRGIDAKDFEARFREDFFARFGKRLENYQRGGFVTKTPKGLAFTPRGMYVSNAILADVLEFPS